MVPVQLEPAPPALEGGWRLEHVPQGLGAQLARRRHVEADGHQVVALVLKRIRLWESKRKTGIARRTTKNYSFWASRFHFVPRRHVHVEDNITRQASWLLMNSLKPETEAKKEDQRKVLKRNVSETLRSSFFAFVSDLDRLTYWLRKKRLNTVTCFSLEK